MMAMLLSVDHHHPHRPHHQAQQVAQEETDLRRTLYLILLTFLVI